MKNKSLKVGALVNILNKWTAHNPWMRFPDEKVSLGLVTHVDDLACTVLMIGTNKQVLVSPNRCEVINEP